MPLKSLSPEQVEQIKADLATLGVEGSPLLAIPKFEQNADAHEYIREILLAFIRSMFRSMPPGEYRWDNDATKSEIDINYADPRGDAEKGSTPAITLELTPFTYGNNSINDLLGGTADGTKYYTTLRNGAVVIRCRSSVKLESDSLAHVIMGSIKYMHQDIERMSGFTWVDAYTANPSSGELQQSSPSGEFFVSNVVANVHYQESWKKPPAVVIKDVVTFVREPKGVFLD